MSSESSQLQPPSEERVSALLTFLDAQGISYKRLHHPAVFTCEAASLHLASVGGLPTKNLFLTDKNRSQFFLVSVPETKKLNLKELAKSLGAGKLSFGSGDDLLRLLGVTAGSVSLLALLNDSSRSVRVVVDSALEGAHDIHCHPLINTETLLISWPGISQFARALGVNMLITDVPQA